MAMVCRGVEPEAPPAPAHDLPGDDDIIAATEGCLHHICVCALANSPNDPAVCQELGGVLGDEGEYEEAHRAGHPAEDGDGIGQVQDACPNDRGDGVPDGREGGPAAGTASEGLYRRDFQRVSGSQALYVGGSGQSEGCALKPPHLPCTQYAVVFQLVGSGGGAIFQSYAIQVQP